MCPLEALKTDDPNELAKRKLYDYVLLGHGVVAIFGFVFLTPVTTIGQLIYIGLLFSMRQKLYDGTRYVYLALLLFNVFNGVLSILTFSPGFLAYIFVVLYYLLAMKLVFPTTLLAEKCCNQGPAQPAGLFGML
jgi:hypothetical protein